MRFENDVDPTGDLTKLQDFVLSVAMTPDAEWVMSGSKDRGVQFWNPRSGDTQLMLQGHKNSGRSPFEREFHILRSC